MLALGALVFALVTGDGDTTSGGTTPTTATTIGGALPQTTATVEVGASPEQAALGPDGSVWVADSFDGTVSRIDPATNDVIDTIPTGLRPFGVAATDQAIWVTNSNESTLSRLEPDTGEIVATVSMLSLIHI